MSIPALPPSSGQRHPVHVFHVITFSPSSLRGCSVVLGSPHLLGVTVRLGRAWGLPPCAPPPQSASRSSPSLAEPHCPPLGVSRVSWPLRPVGDPRLAWLRVCPGQRAPLRWPGSKAPPLGHLQGSDLRESSVPSQAGSLRAMSDARVRLGAPVLRLCPSGVSPFPAIPQVSGHSSCPSFALSPGVCPGTAPRFQPAAPPPRAAVLGEGRLGCGVLTARGAAQCGFGFRQVIRHQETVTVTLGKLSNLLVPRFPHP